MMSSRRSARKGEPMVQEEIPVTVEEMPVLSLPPVAVVRGYHAGPAWNGLDRWECDFCPADGLVESALRQHVADVHWPQMLHPEAAAGGPLLLDRFGNPLTAG